MTLLNRRVFTTALLGFPAAAQAHSYRHAGEIDIAAHVEAAPGE